MGRDTKILVIWVSLLILGCSSERDISSSHGLVGYQGNIKTVRGTRGMDVKYDTLRIAEVSKTGMFPLDTLYSAAMFESYYDDDDLIIMHYPLGGSGEDSSLPSQVVISKDDIQVKVIDGSITTTQITDLGSDLKDIHEYIMSSSSDMMPPAMSTHFYNWPQMTMSEAKAELEGLGFGCDSIATRLCSVEYKFTHTSFFGECTYTIKANFDISSVSFSDVEIYINDELFSVGNPRSVTFRSPYSDIRVDKPNN